MHVGTSYGLLEAARWTGRKMAVLGVSASLVVGLYQGCGWAWLALPWPVIAMLGTAASFIVGFKNAQTYQRTVEAQQIWSAITASSRYWGLLSRDFPDDASAATGPLHNRRVLPRRQCGDHGGLKRIARSQSCALDFRYLV